MKYQNIREEELKNKIAQDYFGLYDCTKIIGNVDFCVCMHPSEIKPSEYHSLLWAEAKKGASDIYKSIVQLVLTIGKARTFDQHLPPAMLGAFDGEKIAFIPYNSIHEVFYINDFNWNVTPSNHDSKEFKLIYATIKTVIDRQSLLFNFLNDSRELNTFIEHNFIVGKFGLSKTKIDKNNFMTIYNKWLHSVKPTIAVHWELAKKTGIVDGDFFLADLLSHENSTLKEKLFVLLKRDYYELDREIDEAGIFSSKRLEFNDKQIAHTQFWNKYDRPPKAVYWDYIVERRDLLVPQDIRERTGSFFTPQMWVELSQKYLADVLGEDWQDEYYVWDCAAGTGNLLAGLTNKYNVWASTLQKQDVDIMRDRIKSGANLLDSHVFQFDFLNDDFSKLPTSLQDIINNPEKRKKLVVYINPPYAEASNRDTVTGKGQNKSKVATKTLIYAKYSGLISTAARELFAQFLIRIYLEIDGCTIAEFSTLKTLQAPNFYKYRQSFKPKLEKIFLCPAKSFDNVKGAFPIGFKIWSNTVKIDFESIIAKVYDVNGHLSSDKKIHAYNERQFIIHWLRNFYDKKSERIAYLRMIGTDFQNSQGVFITNSPSKNDIRKSLTNLVTSKNIIPMSIYLTMRHCIKATWLNDRDQFLYPNDGWKTDTEFQNDCLVFTLFHSQNKITSKNGTNHWIPFTEQAVNAPEKFESNFMSQFINGKLKPDENTKLFEDIQLYQCGKALEFSPKAAQAFDAARKLWRYYHQHALPSFGGAFEGRSNYTVNASLYDIREYFQGRGTAGKMNSKSLDETYTLLVADLREILKQLAEHIEPKVYKYGFLKV